MGTLTVITTLFFFVLLYFWQKNRIDFDPVRLAVFPFAGHFEDQGSHHWEGFALAEATTRYLSQIDPEQLFPYETAWLFTALNADSMTSKAYLLRFSKRVKLDYVVVGSVQETSAKQYQIESQLIAVSNQEVVVDERENVPRDGLLSFTNNLGAKVSAKLMGGQGNVPLGSDQLLDSGVVDYFVAKQLFLNSHYEQALAHAEASFKEDSTSIQRLNLLAEVLLGMANENYQNGKNSYWQYQQAKVALQKVLALDAYESHALRLLGELNIEDRKWTQAESYLKQAIKANPWDPRIYYLLTQLHRSRYRDLGFANEEALLKRAIYINPCFFEARFALANYYEKKKRLDVSIDLVKEVLNINPTSIDGLMAIGKLYMAQNDLLHVLETYEKLLKLQPENADAYYNLGIVYYHSKDYETAIKFFKRAIEIGDHLNSHLFLAYIYELQGKMGLAVKHLRIRVRKQVNEHDVYAEEARKHLFEIMQRKGVIDSLYSSSNHKN